MNRKQEYYPTLDGWRAVSIIMVILYHASDSLKDVYGDQASLIYRYIHCGSAGVSIFFGISGLLITGRLLSEWNDKTYIDLKRFYIRRVFRLLPPVLWLILWICILAAFFGLPVSITDRLRALLFASNYGPLPSWYLAHTWSLSVEEHFYIFWPLVLISLGSKRGLYFALLLSVIVTVWRMVDIHWKLVPDFIGTSPWRTDTNVDYLLLGAAVACFISQNKNLEKIKKYLTPTLTIILTVCGAIAVFAREFNSHYQHPVRILIALIIPFLILGTIVNPEMWISKILECSVLRWIGKLSFSLYLWQQLFLTPNADRFLALGHLQIWPWNIIAAFLCAIISYYVIEKPFIKIGHSIASSIKSPAK